MPRTSFFTATVMFTGFGVIIGNGTAADEFCIVHPLAPSCEHQPALPDEQPNQPTNPFGSVRPLMMANSTVTFSGVGYV